MQVVMEVEVVKKVEGWEGAQLEGLEGGVRGSGEEATPNQLLQVPLSLLCGLAAHPPTTHADTTLMACRKPP